jgi:hypothetical protein
MATFTGAVASSRLAVRKAPSSDPSVLLLVLVSTVKRYAVDGFRLGTRNWCVKSSPALAEAQLLT